MIDVALGIGLGFVLIGVFAYCVGAPFLPWAQLFAAGLALFCVAAIAKVLTE